MVDTSSSDRLLEPAALQQAVGAGAAHAAELGIRVAVVVVGRDGRPLALLRHPRAFLTAGPVAAGKAFAACNFGASTAELAERIPAETRADLGRVQPQLSFIRGGVPISLGDGVIGGIGVSGGSSEQDEAVALRAREALLAGDGGGAGDARR